MALAKAFLSSPWGTANAGGAELNRTGELGEVAMNLNFDMLASPNFITGIYNGSDPGSQYPKAVAGSTYLQKLFQGGRCLLM
ncbi:hypothetical protein T484DRAFT_1795352 [Baffinella frigidus]|nr:hypothetical protein T484DRAFT_1795352 [Cryptophyta sp. CCMP2293]